MLSFLAYKVEFTKIKNDKLRFGENCVLKCNTTMPNSAQV